VPKAETRLADIIMSRAYYMGREGDAVCEMDRDGEPYLRCQEAAQEIMAMIRDLVIPNVAEIIEANVEADYVHAEAAAERILKDFLHD